ncbi:unnamed protein product [Sphagnum troendelagicum]|uniref:Uncharacterized protein n=1 Tax=Sphagnum troendelagicum TaxID=128251 RepID=A0ABP0UGP2_9BRYO
MNAAFCDSQMGLSRFGDDDDGGSAKICMLEVFLSVFQLQSNGGDGSSSTFGLKWISTPHTHLGGFLFASSRRLHL